MSPPPPLPHLTRLRDTNGPTSSLPQVRDIDGPTSSSHLLPLPSPPPSLRSGISMDPPPPLASSPFPHLFPSSLTSQGSGIPMDPGRNSPAERSMNILLKLSTMDRGSSPLRGIMAQLHCTNTHTKTQMAREKRNDT